MQGPRIGFRESLLIKRTLSGDIRGYHYSTPFITVPAAGSNFETLSLEDDFDFVAQFVTSVTLIASTFRRVDPGFFPPARAIISTNSSNADMQNRDDTFLGNIAGTAERPRKLRQPFYVRRSGVVTVSVVNVAAVDYLVQVTLHGYKTTQRVVQ